MTLRYGSVCSGIEAASVAWGPLGWEAAWFAEIAPFPSAVLAHHYPEVPNLGDFTRINGGEYSGSIDLLVGGTPCQSFSVAGGRAGLDDPRGDLALEFLALARRLRPRWLLFENVPGLLSSDEGRDFGTFLGALGECGYGCAWRVLDAQYFGVPQRRRRPFVVGYLGDWRPAAAVLLERESMSGHSPPSREAGAGVAPILEAGARTNGDGYRDGDGIGEPGDPMYSLQSRHQHAIAFGGNNTSGPIDVATAVNAHGGAHGRQDFESETFVTAPLTGKPWADHESQESKLVAHTLRGRGHDASEDVTGRGVPLVTAFHNRQDPCVSGDITQPLGAKDNGMGVAFTQNQAGDVLTGEIFASMGTNQNATGRNTPKVMENMAVRRLTPRECERLMGFPDDYTRIPMRHYAKRKITEERPADYWEKNGDGWWLMAADGPRYAAIGNSIAVTVMRWLGERIEMVEAIRNDSGLTHSNQE